MPEIHYSSEMGITHADFFRILPKAMGVHKYRIDGHTVHADLHLGQVQILLGPQMVRKIALLELPYASVSFTFTGVSEAQQTDFKANFDLYFRRGGG